MGGHITRYLLEIFKPFSHSRITCKYMYMLKLIGQNYIQLNKGKEAAYGFTEYDIPYHVIWCDRHFDFFPDIDFYR